MSDGITVSGGAGGVRAQLSELAELAASLRAAVGALEAAHSARSRLAIAAGAQTASVLAPLDGRHGLRACAHVASELSRRLGVVRAAYADADAQAATRMRGVAVGLGHAIGEGGVYGLGLVVGVGYLSALQLAVLRLHKRLPTPLGLWLRWLGSPSIAGRHDAVGAFGRLFVGESVLPRMPVVDRATTDAVVAGVGAWIHASPSGRQGSWRIPSPAPRVPSWSTPHGDGRVGCSSYLSPRHARLWCLGPRPMCSPWSPTSTRTPVRCIGSTRRRWRSNASTTPTGRAAGWSRSPAPRRGPPTGRTRWTA